MYIDSHKRRDLDHQDAKAWSQMCEIASHTASASGSRERDECGALLAVFVL